MKLDPLLTGIKFRGRLTPSFKPDFRVAIDMGNDRY